MNVESRLVTILTSINKVYQYTNDFKTYEDFSTNQMAQDAVFMQLIVIGETANSLPMDFRQSHPKIPWEKIIGVRNLIAHGYQEIQLPIIWDIRINDLPVLQSQIDQLIHRNY